MKALAPIGLRLPTAAPNRSASKGHSMNRDKRLLARPTPEA